MKTKNLLTGLALAAGLTGAASAATLSGELGIDFGNASASSTLVTDDGYNAFTAEPAGGLSASLTSLTNKDGFALAGVGFELTNNTDNTATRAAALNPTVYIVNDQTSPNDVTTSEFVTLTFSGLTPGITYDLSGGFKNGTNANFDVNWTLAQGTIGGSTTQLADASATGFINFVDITPTAGGIIEFNLAGTSTGATHISVDHLTLTGVAVPEPSSAALLGLGGLALILRRRK